MSVELVRWAKKVGDFLSYPVGTQRACPLVPTDIRHMAVERAPPPLRHNYMIRAADATKVPEATK